MKPADRSRGLDPGRLPLMDDVIGAARYLIISDIHLGSRYCRRKAFLACLDRLPPGVALVLNGDIVDRIHGPMPAEDGAVIDRLREESGRRPITWIYGNHDAGWSAEGLDNLRFADDLVIDDYLYLAHGHGFDAIMPTHRWFVRFFRSMHHLRIVMGAEAVHVAVYAKRWERLYRVLRRHVMHHAVEYARQRGCSAVACGHTHYGEQQEVDGIRYFNTGSWTESPLVGLVVGSAPADLCLARLA